MHVFYVFLKGEAMQPSQSKINTDKPKTELFEFQNWEVYRKCLLLTKETFEIAKELSRYQDAKLSDLLKRASTSVVLNLAQGVSCYSLRDKSNFWRIAKGSLFECVAILDVVEVVSDAEFKTSKDLKEDMQSIGRMLSGLLRWAEKQNKG